MSGSSWHAEPSGERVAEGLPVGDAVESTLPLELRLSAPASERVAAGDLVSEGESEGLDEGEGEAELVEEGEALLCAEGDPLPE